MAADGAIFNGNSVIAWMHVQDLLVDKGHGWATRAALDAIQVRRVGGHCRLSRRLDRLTGG